MSINNEWCCKIGCKNKPRWEINYSGDNVDIYASTHSCDEHVSYFLEEGLHHEIYHIDAKKTPNQVKKLRVMEALT